MDYYKNNEKCRVCGSHALTEVIKLAPQYISSTFVKTNIGNKMSNISIPLTVLLCDRSKNIKGCGLVQLREAVDPDLLYTNYFYRSAVSDTMRADLEKVVIKSQDKTSLDEGDVVVDIGANDCTMLTFFPSNTVRIGVEPAKNIDWTGLNKSIKIVNNYFSRSYLDPVLEGRKVKIFTACAMFYDLHDPNSFVADIKSLLAPQGIWCIQLSYIVLMLKNLNFYDICHEHLEYYSLQTLSTLIERHGLEIFDAETNEVNGGSLLVFVTHKEDKRERSGNLEKLLQVEAEMKLYDSTTYRKFYEHMQDLARRVRGYIENEINNGGNVIGLGASTKGNVLLQFFGIDKKMLPYISERNPIKVGLRTLGSDIELISEERARKLNPVSMLVLPWYFKREIVAREKEYIENGGTLLFLMPYPHLVTKDGEVNL